MGPDSQRAPDPPRGRFSDLENRANRWCVAPGRRVEALDGLWHPARKARDFEIHPGSATRLSRVCLRIDEENLVTFQVVSKSGLPARGRPMHEGIGCIRRFGA